MKPVRRLNRRSFFRQVAGGAAAAGALGVIGGEARAWQTGPYTGVTDNDSGSYADNAGHGRGPGGNASGHPNQNQGSQTGYSDSDSGANADPSGGGRDEAAGQDVSPAHLRGSGPRLPARPGGPRRREPARGAAGVAGDGGVL